MRTPSPAGSSKRASRVLVIGAVGNVGREVVRSLRAHGREVRAADLSVGPIRAMHGDDIEAAVLNFEAHETFATAVKGCDSIFLVRPPAITCMESTLLPFIDAAFDSGVKHIVFLSCAGAATNKLVPHHAVEKHLAARGVTDFSIPPERRFSPVPNRQLQALARC